MSITAEEAMLALWTSEESLAKERYNLFYNPNPMDVTIKDMPGEDGKLKDITLPNLAKEKKKIDDFVAGAENTMPFLNLLKNVHMTKKDENDNYIEIPHTMYSMDIESYRVVDATVTDVPEVVKDYIAGGVIRGHGNVLEIKFTKNVSSNTWLALNSVSGTFTGGWKWVHVAQGKLRDINAGETKSFFDVRVNRNWHVDLPMGDFEENTIVYLAHPFLVAGKITNINNIKTLNYTSNTKYVNLY